MSDDGIQFLIRNREMLGGEIEEVRAESFGGDLMTMLKRYDPVTGGEKKLGVIDYDVIDIQDLRRPVSITFSPIDCAPIAAVRFGNDDTVNLGGYYYVIGRYESKASDYVVEPDILERTIMRNSEYAGVLAYMTVNHDEFDFDNNSDQLWRLVSVTIIDRHGNESNPHINDGASSIPYAVRSWASYHGIR